MTQRCVTARKMCVALNKCGCDERGEETVAVLWLNHMGCIIGSECVEVERPGLASSNLAIRAGTAVDTLLAEKESASGLTSDLR